MNKLKILILTTALIFGFILGVLLGFANHAAQAMNYDVGQALALLPVPVGMHLNYLEFDAIEGEKLLLEPVDMHQPEPITPEPVTAYLGTYTITAYCPCSICCGKWSNPDDPRTASGTRPAELITVGADWDKLPAGTKLYIDGVGERVVEDKVAGWISDKYDGRVLDLFFYDHTDAQAFGKMELDVWMIE